MAKTPTPLATTITDPQAVKFSNEQLRPLCESTSALVVQLQSMETAWYAGINNLFPNDTTVLDDGRQAEGVSVLTGADVNSAMSVLIAMIGQYNSQIIEKPCVRPLSES